MIDPARVLEFRDRTLGEATVKQPVGPVSMFQDFYVTYKTTYVEASVGQFKIPVSWEGYNSSSKLLFAERAPVSRAFGDKRDLGIRLAKKFERFGYMAGRAGPRRTGPRTSCVPCERGRGRTRTGCSPESTQCPPVA